MDKGRLAEWLLAPALGSARASWVVGDLLEAAAGRGPGWFWGNVARTWCGAPWGDLRTRPLFCLGLAVRGGLLLSAWLFLVGRGRTLVWDFVRTGLPHSHFLVHHPKEWLWPAVTVASLLATAHAGWWVARRCQGRLLAVCAALALVYPLVAFGFHASWAAVASIGPAPDLPLPDFSRFLYQAQDAGFAAAFLLGVALLRRPLEARSAA